MKSMMIEKGNIKMLTMYMYAQFHQFVHSGLSLPLLNSAIMTMAAFSHEVRSLYGGFEEGKKDHVKCRFAPE